MDLKKFKAVAEDEHSYTIEHPSGKKLFIEKAKLSQGAHKAIQCLYQGAQVEGGGGTDLSNLGGGDPMASLSAPPPAPSTAAPAAPQGKDAYAEYAPDLSKEDIADLDAPVRNKDGSVVTKFGRDVKGMAKDKALVSQFSVPDDQKSPRLPDAQQNQLVADAAVSRAPDATTPASQDPLIQEKEGIQGLLQKQIEAQQTAMEAGQSAGKDIANVQQSGADQLANLPSYNDLVAGYQAKDQKLAQDYADAKIDPEHFMHTMGTGSKILTGIGMVLSGMGAATTGQPSYAMQVINDAIKRDVDAQASDKAGKMNLWKMNREAMGNDVAANLATQNQIQAGVLAKLQAAQTRAALPQEKLRAQQAIDQLQQQMLQNNMQRGLISGQGTGAGGSPALSHTDPAVMVPQFIKDPAQQAKAFEEIRKRQNISQNGQAMFNALEDAVKETSGVAGSVKSMLPDAFGFTSPAVSKLNNLAQPMLDTIDESVRQSGKDSFLKNVMPRGTDNAAQTQGRREALAQWLHSQAAAPISLGASGRAIDLNRFQSTAIPNFGAATPPPAQTAMKNGHTYQKVQGGWKLVK